MDEKDRHIITFDADPDDAEASKGKIEIEIPKTEPDVEPGKVAREVEAEIAGAGFTMTPSEDKPTKVENSGFNMTTSEPEVDVPKTAAEIELTPTAPKNETEVAGTGFTMKPTEDKPASVEGSGFTMTPSEPEDKAQDLKKDFDAIDSDVKINTSYDVATETTTEKVVTPRPEIKTSTTVASGTGSSSGSGGNHYAAKPVKPKKEKKYVTRGALIACMILTMLLSTILGSVLGAGLFGRSSNPDSARAERKDSELSQLNLSDATGSELTVSEIVDKNADAVVEIVVSGTTQGMWGQMQLTEGAGSGVVVREDGYVATNYHVIQGANKVQVTLHNGEAYPAQIVGSDPSNDVAVIKINESGLTTASIGDSSKVSVGDLAVAIGNPLGQLGGTATTGIISALDRTLSVEGTTLTLLQTDAAINGGNSGGGLFDSKGDLIGIVESKAAAVGVEGLAFALPINSVSEIINDIIENGGNVNGQTAGTPAVGVVISDVSEEQSQYYGLNEPGVYIAQVTGANAQQAGFREQDRIVSFNGTEIKDSSTFISLVRKCKVGDTVTIVVSRDGQEIEIKTVLEELQTNQ